MESSIRQMLIPKDPQDEKNAILEIRAGTGGDEASRCLPATWCACTCAIAKAGAGKRRLSENEGSVGGYKEVQIEVVGDDVYGT
jgi:peptide chain release factor 1